jgi:hypothetical protein
MLISYLLLHLASYLLSPRRKDPLQLIMFELDKKKNRPDLPNTQINQLIDVLHETGKKKQL